MSCKTPYCTSKQHPLIHKAKLSDSFCVKKARCYSIQWYGRRVLLFCSREMHPKSQSSIKISVFITTKLGLIYLDQCNLSITRWRSSHCSELHDFHKTHPALKITNASAEGSGQKRQQSPHPKGTLKGWKNAVAQWEMNFTSSLPALAGIQLSQVKVGVGTSHLRFCLLQKTYPTKPRSSAPRSTHIFLIKPTLQD